MNPGLYTGLSASTPIVPLSITPASVTTLAGAQTTFVAHDGTGTGYTFSLLVNNSGGSIDSSTGVYTAGSNIDPAGDELDVVMVVDSGLNSADANVGVLGPVSTGLKLWLKADAGVTQSGGTVSSWADQSGNGNDVTQATGANQPAFNASSINGQPGLTFNGTGDRLNNTVSNLVASGAARTAIIVAKSSATSCGCILAYRNSPFCPQIWGIDAGGGNDYCYSDGASQAVNLTDGRLLTNGVPTVLENHYTFGILNFSVVTNGVTRTTSTNGVSNHDTGATGFVVGDQGGGGGWYHGDICEILVYDSILSGTDLTATRAYLTAKYGIAL